MIVGFQGEPGAFSDAAARRLRPGAQTRGYPSFDLLVAAVDGGEIDAALLPVENSIAGSIARSYDLLWEYRNLHAIAETAYPVEMNLIGTLDADEAGIREIRSHPVALEQIHRFAGTHPNWKRVAVADTAGAVAEIVALGDPTVAAVGPALAAELYGAKVLRTAIQDDPRNFTRFYLLSRTAQRRGSLGCVAIEVENRPGTLRDALSAFADRGLDLRSLVARPNHVDPFHYRFFFEIGDVDRQRLDAALAALDGPSRVIGIFSREP
ncbi:MAG: prephenate dehydratase domain-containing protein [Candidatus Lustribacter sp.]|jgi:prephenate dehydratase